MPNHSRDEAKPPVDIQQAEVIEFLRQPDAYGGSPGSITVVETHAALIFLAGCEVYKIKKAVVYPYLDFSSLEKREAVCRKELSINQLHAPNIYLGVVAITREPDGHLEIDGSGAPVEWAVHMRRFPEDAVLEQAVRIREFKPDFFDRLADAVSHYHEDAPKIISGDGFKRIAAVIDELSEAFRATPGFIPEDELQQFTDNAKTSLNQARSCLNLRSQQGYVRRGHGDLHLGNIVVLAEQPVLFDAIEFSDEIATVDVLYDLAFLLMELDRCSMSAAANRIMNRYMSGSGALENIDGLAAMPLFLACRAGVRAMVAITRVCQVGEGKGQSERSLVLSYFHAALGYLEPAPVRFVAVGGFSGSGKTVLARKLAPLLSRCPGALHLRTDIERKSFFGAEETTRLGQECYLPEVNEEIYARIFEKAARGLRAGFSVVVDAAFLDPRERTTIEDIARDAKIPFTGIWLEADIDTLANRVDARTGDASDATKEVVHQQISRGVGSVSWHHIDTNSEPEETLLIASQICQLRVNKG